MTLIETILALIIGLILLTFGTSAWQHFIEKNRADVCVNRIVRAVNFTKMEAIKSGDIITLCGSSDRSVCDGNWTAGQIIRKDKTPEKVIFVFNEIPGKGELSWAGFPSKKYLKINPQGMLESQNGTFIYESRKRDPRYQRKVVVSKGGRVRLLKA